MSKTIGTEAIKKPLQKSDLSKKALCDYVVNVATGCLHGCTFCYVPSTPIVRMRSQHLKDRGVADPQLGWGDYLFLRTDAPELLDRQLAAMRSWHSSPAGKGVVMLCSTTDPYQNLQTARITRRCVEVLLRHGKRVRILTRSPLWLRDIDILSHPNATVGMSIPHLDDRLSRAIEPFAPLPSSRVRAMQVAAQVGVRRFVAIAPTPGLDSVADVQPLVRAIADIDPEVMFWEPINARGTNRQRMAGTGAALPPSGRDWPQWFERQADIIAESLPTGLRDRLHPWPDAALPESDFVRSWRGKPSIEEWQ